MFLYSGIVFKGSFEWGGGMGVIANRGLVLPGMPLSARAWVQVFLNGMAFPFAEARTRRMRQCVPGLL